MSIKPTDRKARENYRKKLKRVQFVLYPTEEDIKQRLDERSEQGEPTATYIKRLIRKDIKSKPIISRETFEAAQEKLREDNKKGE